MKRIKYILMVIGIFGITLTGCNNNSKNNSETDHNISSKSETNEVAYALIHLEDGSSIELKSPRQRVNSNAPSSLTAKMNEDGMVVMIKLDRYKTPLEEKVYEDPIEAQITLTSISHDGLLGKETYRSFNTNEGGEEGDVKINLISHGDNHSEGTFEGTLYSQNHKKATIEGKFKTKEKK